MRSSSFVLLLLAATWISLTPRLQAQPTPDDVFTVACGHYQRGRWRQATDMFEQFVRQSPTDARTAAAHLYAGEALMQLKEYAEARNHFEILQEVVASGGQAAAPFASRALFRLGQVAFFRELPAEAERILSQFVGAFPQDPLNAYALSYLGQLALDREAWSDAETRLSESLEHYPQGPLAHQCRFGLAQCMQQRGEFAEAQRFYEYLISIEDSSVAQEARVRLGRLYFEQQRFEDAANVCRPVVASEQPELAPAAGYWLGHSLRGLQQWRAAAECLEQCAEQYVQHPLAPEMLYFAGGSYAELGEADVAQALYAKLASRWPTSRWRAEALAEQIELQIAAGQWEQATVIAAEFLDRWPWHARAWRVRRELARRLLQRHLPAEAIAVLEPAVGVAGDSQPAASWYLLALSYQTADRGADAVAAASQGLSAADADDLRGALLLVQASALSSIADHATAADVYSDVLRQPLDVVAQAQTEAALLVERTHAGQWSQVCAATTDHALTQPLRPSLAAAWRFAADTAYQQQQYQVAAQLYQRLLESQAEPQDAALAGRGWSAYKLGQPDEARVFLQQLMHDYPDSPFTREAQPLLAGLLEHSHQRGPAIDAYLELARSAVSPRQASQALRRAAELLLQDQQGEQALELLERLETKFPAYEQLDAVYYQRAVILQSLGRTPERTTALRQLIQQFPDSPLATDAIWRLAEQAALEGQTRAALDWAHRLLAQADASEELIGYAHMLAGRLLAQQGQWESAADHWRTLRASLPEHPLNTAVGFWLAEAAFQLHHYEEAAQRFGELAAQRLDAQPSQRPAAPVALLRQAQAVAHLRQWRSAQQLLEPLLTPTSHWSLEYEAWYLHGRCCAALGQFAEARQAYQRVLEDADARRSETAAKAQWMIGETYFHQRQYREAIVAYHLVEMRHAHPQWQAWALLQAGKCHEQLRDPAAGRLLLEQIIREFPETPAAAEARGRLANQADTVRQAGLIKERQ